MTDEYDLQRFLDAQQATYESALTLLRRGAMCRLCLDFVFPRISFGETDNPFALASLDAARAYLAFPVLGNRYRECVEALPRLVANRPCEMFGKAGMGKLQASLTLFTEATCEPLMRTVLVIWFDNLVDEATLARIAETG